VAAEVRLEPATLRHVHLVAPRMRRADREEVMASGGYRPAQALRRALRSSEVARTAFVGGEPLMVFGVAAGNGFAIPWALTTDVVDKHPMAFWRVSTVALAALREVYPVMVQMVDARHQRSLDWLERLGFQVAKEPEPFGKLKLPFHRVTLGVSHV
jgi:hypothetical protein